jgi:hypothetical protein
LFSVVFVEIPDRCYRLNRAKSESERFASDRIIIYTDVLSPLLRNEANVPAILDFDRCCVEITADA